MNRLKSNEKDNPTYTGPDGIGTDRRGINAASVSSNGGLLVSLTELVGVMTGVVGENMAKRIEMRSMITCNRQFAAMKTRRRRRDNQQSLHDLRLP